MVSGRPSDTDLRSWYSMAWLVDQNRATNKAFQSAYRAPAAATRPTPFLPLLLRLYTHLPLLSPKGMHTVSPPQETQCPWTWAPFENGPSYLWDATDVENQGISVGTAQKLLTSVL